MANVSSLKLFKVWIPTEAFTEADWYDRYDAFIVVSESEERAKCYYPNNPNRTIQTLPSGKKQWMEPSLFKNDGTLVEIPEDCGPWVEADDVDDWVKAKVIGTPEEGMVEGEYVICSYNAG